MLSYAELIVLLSVIFSLFLSRSIVKKAGYSGWWALTVIIPLINIIMIWVFSFVKWPAESGLLPNNSSS